MSNIRNVEELKKAALARYGKQPDGTTMLWADRKYADDLFERIEEMSSDVSLEGVISPMPRYGLLTLMLRTTPCYVYGHPAMAAKCKTAFTNGVHVFIYQGFYDKLMKDERESRGTEYGVEPLVMHEMMHKMYDHVGRLRQFPPDLANRAADLSINTRLKQAFPEIEWCKSLRETGLGFKPGDSEKYLPLAEESICRELLNEDLKKRRSQSEKDQKGKGQGQPQPGGKPQPGQGQPGGQAQPGDQGQPGQDETDESDKFGGEGDNHMIDLNEMIETLEEAGLTEVLDLLNLPPSGSEAEIGRILKDNEDRQHEAIQQAAAMARDAGGKFPGQHLAEHAEQYLKGFAKGQLNWKLAVREMVLGDGMKFRGSYDVPADIAYVDEVEEDLGTPLYLQSEIPHKPDETVLVLIDTSGSVSEEDLRAFFTEIFELKTASENMGDSASEVIVISADTVMRGQPIEITDDNVDQLMTKGMAVFGRGGTDLGTSLATALKLPLMKEKKIRSVIYFTDLYDNPPKRENLGIHDATSIVYVAAPSTEASHQEEFAKAVSSYARVVTIRSGAEVDLEEATRMTVSPSRR